MSIFVLFVAWSLSAAPVFLGYLYPSGGQQGTTVRVIVGGQGFNNKLTLLTNNPGIKLKTAVRVPSMGYFHPPQNPQRLSAAGIPQAQHQAILRQVPPSAEPPPGADAGFRRE